MTSTIVLYFLTCGVNQNYPTEDLIQRNSTPQCIPAKNIGFLKIHKAASTSIQNIILRKSLRENLNVVVPKRGQNQLLDPHGMFTPFNSSWLNSQTPWHKTFMRENAYNVMALHCKWNHQSIRYVLCTIHTHSVTRDLEILALVAGFYGTWFLWDHLLIHNPLFLMGIKRIRL